MVRLAVAERDWDFEHIVQQEIVSRLSILSGAGEMEDLFLPAGAPGRLAYDAFQESMEGHTLDPSVTEAGGRILDGTFAKYAVRAHFVDLRPPGSR